jgi:hypothetical protein
MNNLDALHVNLYIDFIADLPLYIQEHDSIFSVFSCLLLSILFSLYVLFFPSLDMRFIYASPPFFL